MQQVNELSINKLRNYIDKAKHQREKDDAGSIHARKLADTHPALGKPLADKLEKKSEKRSKGINMALDKWEKKLDEVAEPTAPGEKKFKDKHKVEVKPDANGNGDDVFKATNIKGADTFPHHGYDKSTDKAVYEGFDLVGHRQRVKHAQHIHILAGKLGDESLKRAATKKLQELAKERVTALGEQYEDFEKFEQINKEVKLSVKEVDVTEGKLVHPKDRAKTAQEYFDEHVADIHKTLNSMKTTLDQHKKEVVGKDVMGFDGKIVKSSAKWGHVHRLKHLKRALEDIHHNFIDGAPHYVSEPVSGRQY